MEELLLFRLELDVERSAASVLELVCDSSELDVLIELLLVSLTSVELDDELLLLLEVRLTSVLEDVESELLLLL